MSLPWTIAKAIFKVVAPSLPELVSTISKLKGRPINEEDDQETLVQRLEEHEKILAEQLQLIEQLAVQIQALQKTLTLALSLAVGGVVLAIAAILLFLFR